jgi:hypothetical protein
MALIVSKDYGYSYHIIYHTIYHIVSYQIISYGADSLKGQRVFTHMEAKDQKRLYCLSFAYLKCKKPNIA